MAFLYKLEHDDGTPAEPPILRTAVPNWSVGDTIPHGGRTLRVIEEHGNYRVVRKHLGLPRGVAEQTDPRR